MTLIEHPILLALVAALAFALGNIMQKKGMLKNHSIFNMKLIAQPSWLMGMVLSGIGISLVYYVTAKSDLTLIQPILALNPLFSVLLGALLLKEHLSPLHYKAVLVGFLGVIILSFDQSKEGAQQFSDEWLFTLPCIALMIYWWLFSKQKASFRLSLLAGMGFGLATILYKILAIKFLSQGDFEWTNLGQVLLNFEVPLYLFAYVGGTIWAQVALVKGQASYVIPIIAAVGTLVPILGGLLVFKEESSILRLLGLIFILISLFMFKKPSVNYKHSNESTPT